MKITNLGSLIRRFQKQIAVVATIALVAGTGILIYSTSSAASISGVSVYLSPANSPATVGSTVTLSIEENSGTNSLDGVSAIVNYPTSSLTFDSLSTANSAFPIAAGTNAGGNGTVTVNGFSEPPYPTGTNDVADITFTVTSASTTSISVTINGSTQVAEVVSPGNTVEGTPTIAGATITLPAPPPVCSSAPSVPTTVSGTSSSPTTIDLSWAASTVTAPCTVTNYTVDSTDSSGANGTVVGSPTTNSLTLTGLTQNTTYYYTVTATDSNSTSAASAVASATTEKTPPPPVCSSAPSVPTDVRGTSSSQTTTDLSWTASTVTAPCTVTNYTVNQTDSSGTNGTVVGSPTTNSLALTGLNPSTTYYYTVTATDSNSTSVASTVGIVTTESTPPPQGCPTGDTGTYPNCVAPSKSGGAPSSTSTTKSTTTTTAVKPETSTTAITPQGSSSSVPVSNGSQVQISAPAIIGPAQSTSSPIVKMQYYLNAKLLATETNSPFTYKLNTRNILNGTYTFKTATYYQDGSTSVSSQKLVVKNPESLTQIRLEVQHYSVPIVAIIVIAALVVLFVFRGHELLWKFNSQRKQMLGADSGSGVIVGGPKSPPDNEPLPTEFAKLEKNDPSTTISHPPSSKTSNQGPGTVITFEDSDAGKKMPKGKS